ncbi:MAG TPA: enoyl-CoA hydratase [Usitatibacter sp.]|nr:enoyl-CoA hydratase [Usitatibacter sp.]
MSESSRYESPTPRLKASLDRGVLNLRFNNPARHNALSIETWSAVPILLERAAQDDVVRLIVFSGEGEKAFASGDDVSQFEDVRAAHDEVMRYERIAETALKAIHDFPKPTLAYIRGYCIGGGLNVAVACDLRIASMDSVFSIPATRLGLGYLFSATKNLTDLVGPGAAKDIVYTARRLDAAEAHRIGLVNRITEPALLPALLDEYVKSITSGAPLTVKAAKRIIHELLKPDADVDLELCHRLILDCFESEDYGEGRRAFMEKRKPVFKGR